MTDMRPLKAPSLLIIISIALTGRGQQPEPATTGQEPTFQVGVSDVALDVDVSEGRRPIDNLTQADFLVKDENVSQSILYFGHSSVPVDLVVLLDVSGSVQKYLGDIAAITRSALRKIEPTDRVAVLIFSRESWIEQSFTSSADDIAAAIEKASHELSVGSGTRILAGIQSAAKYLGTQKTSDIRRRAILIVTDNHGVSYGIREESVLRSLYAANIALSAIVVGRHPHPPAPRPGTVINPDFAFDDVFPLAEATGGDAIATNKPQDNLAEMLMRIRNRYTLVYHLPGNAAAGGFRNVGVELSPATKKKYSRAEVRTRRGYYVSDIERSGISGDR
jgi:VWFA-related protein